MEFIEAPAFTRHLPDYLSDDGYKEVQARLAANPEVGNLMPGQADSERCGGRTPVAARVAEQGCGLSITTLDPTVRYG